MRLNNERARRHHVAAHVASYAGDLAGCMPCQHGADALACWPSELRDLPVSRRSTPERALLALADVDVSLMCHYCRAQVHLIRLVSEVSLAASSVIRSNASKEKKEGE